MHADVGRGDGNERIGHLDRFTDIRYVIRLSKVALSCARLRFRKFMQRARNACHSLMLPKLLLPLWGIALSFLALVVFGLSILILRIKQGY